MKVSPAVRRRARAAALGLRVVSTPNPALSPPRFDAIAGQGNVVFVERDFESWFFGPGTPRGQFVHAPEKHPCPGSRHRPGDTG